MPEFLMHLRHHTRVAGLRFFPSTFLTAMVAVASLLPVASAAAERNRAESSTLTDRSRIYQARVTRVHDGDTVWVQPIGGGRYRKLRLDGLDAPEICQDGGVASRDALAARILQQWVTVSERAYDDYGRALAHLQFDGEDVGSRLVSQGHAWSYRWRNSLGPYAQEEAKARAYGRGLFADHQAEVPRDFRKRHGPCQRPG